MTAFKLNDIYFYIFDELSKFGIFKFTMNESFLSLFIFFGGGVFLKKVNPHFLNWIIYDEISSNVIERLLEKNEDFIKYFIQETYFQKKKLLEVLLKTILVIMLFKFE